MKDYFDQFDEEDFPSPAEVRADVFVGQMGALTLGLLVGLFTSKDNKRTMALVAFVGCFLAILYKLEGLCPFSKKKEDASDEFSYDDCDCCDYGTADDFFEEDLPY